MGTAYLAVLATLKFEFAKTVALALGIADMLKFFFVRTLGPVLAFALGPDLKHWVHPIIGLGVKVIAVIVACYIQMIISSFYAGLRGGLLFAVALFHLLEKHAPS